MKTSVKLLLGTLLLVVAAMFGAAISLRKQYDAIDKTDPYARWKKIPLGTFRAVSINAQSPMLVQVERGDVPQLLEDSQNRWQEAAYTYKVERDTLFLTLNAAKDWYLNPEDTNDDIETARLVVQMPMLQAVSTLNANCQILDHTGTSLSIEQRGRGGRTLLEHVRYEQLTARLTGLNQLTVRAMNNKITNAAITLADSARLHQYSNIAGTFSVDAAPGTSVRLTGQTLTKVKADR
jgi:hypothetical protein